MSGKLRIPKTASERLRDCEVHLYFLWDAMRLYPEQRDRFKQIATELRVLVCRTRMNKPLLLDLMDEYRFSYEVQPPGKDTTGPPLKPQPLPMVGWRDDPQHQRLTDDLAHALKTGDEGRLAAIESELASPVRSVPFREWGERGLAVYVAPYDYSHKELVLAIAQQFGSSHEDDSVEEPIVRLRQVIIGGEMGDVAPLVAFARLVLSVGQKFLDHLVTNYQYAPAYFNRPTA